MSKRDLANNQEGVISLLVTIIFVIILGLIILGFGEISSSQNSQTLNNQLSNKSYYAAQSAINEITQGIIKGDLTGQNDSSCDGLIPNKTPPQNLISTYSGTAPYLQFIDSSTKITCAKYNTLIPKLVYNSVSSSASKIARINLVNSDGSPLNTQTYTINISWIGSNSNNSTNLIACDSSNFFVAQLTATYNPSCGAGLLRVGVAPDPSTVNLYNTNNKDTNLLNSGGSSPLNNWSRILENQSNVIYFVPDGKATNSSIMDLTLKNTPINLRSDNYGNINSSNVVSGNNTSGAETASIKCYNENPIYNSTNNPSADDASLTNIGKYCDWLNLVSLGQDSNVTISAQDANANTLYFSGSEAQIDVTAVTNGVARRVLAYSTISSIIPSNSASYALQSTNSICKLLTLKNTTGILSATDFNDPANKAVGSDTCSFKLN